MHPVLNALIILLLAVLLPLIERICIEHANVTLKTDIKNKNSELMKASLRKVIKKAKCNLRQF